MPKSTKLGVVTRHPSLSLGRVRRPRIDRGPGGGGQQRHGAACAVVARGADGA